MEISKKAYIIMICGIVIVSFFSANYFYHIGYDEGISKLEDCKDELQIYHIEWNETEEYDGHFREYLSIKNTNFMSTRIRDDFYALYFANYKKSDETFDIFCILPEKRNDSRCEIRITNVSCLNKDNINLNCSKRYRYYGGELE